MKIVYRYDTLDRLVETIWEDGRRETYAYDAAGNRLAVNPTAQFEARENSLAAKAAPAPDSLGAPSLGDVTLITFRPAPVAATPVAVPAPIVAELAGPRTAPVDIFTLSIQLENQRISMSDQLRLGSEADNDLTLPDKKVSLHHAIIQRRGLVYKITDLNSDSGTHVNGKRITEPTLLRNGDVVLIGDTRLTISDQR